MTNYWINNVKTILNRFNGVIEWHIVLFYNINIVEVEHKWKYNSTVGLKNVISFSDLMLSLSLQGVS